MKNHGYSIARCFSTFGMLRSQCTLHRTSTRRFLSNEFSQSENESIIVNTISLDTKEGVDWNDRVGLQSKWDNPSKGWKVKVEWRETPYGAGLFAAQDIPTNTVLRVGLNRRNLLQFQSCLQHRLLMARSQ